MNSFIKQISGKIPAFDNVAAELAKARWDSIAKPLGSLGLLEKLVVRVAGLTGDASYRMDKRVVLVLCADNGVVRHGVSQVGSEVTAALARALAKSDLTVCTMATLAGADIIGVDMGMNENLNLPQLLDRRIAAGTADLSEGPAMSREQAIQAIQHGVDLVGHCHERGYKIVATGELGIGNTTTSSAMAAVFLDKKPAEVTGHGAGLSQAGVRQKIAVIEKAIALNNPNPGDGLDVLCKLGGFDIAGLVGVFLGGLLYRIPVLVDGLISSVAALTARKLCPSAEMAMFASHVSAEPAAQRLLMALGLEPLLHAGMHLGEGTGAVAVLPVIDMAFAVYGGMSTYEDIAIGRYKPLN